MKEKTKNAIICLIISGYFAINGLVIYNLPNAFFKLIAWIGCEEVV